MPVVVIAEITHLSKHDTVAGEGLAICPHMSSFVSKCLRLSQSGQAVNNALEGHISKTLQNLCFQAESARVSPKKVKEKRYEKLY